MKMNNEYIEIEQDLNAIGINVRKMKKEIIIHTLYENLDAYKYVVIYINKKGYISFAESTEPVSGFNEEEVWSSFKKVNVHDFIDDFDIYYDNTTKQYRQDKFNNVFDFEQLKSYIASHYGRYGSDIQEIYPTQYKNMLTLFNDFRHRFLFHRFYEIEEDIEGLGINVRKMKKDILNAMITEKNTNEILTIHIKRDGTYDLETTQNYMPAYTAHAVDAPFYKIHIKFFLSQEYLPDIEYNAETQLYKNGDEELTFDELKNMVIDTYDLSDVSHNEYERLLKTFDSFRLYLSLSISH